MGRLCEIIIKGGRKELQIAKGKRDSVGLYAYHLGRAFEAAHIGYLVSEGESDIIEVDKLWGCIKFELDENHPEVRIDAL